MRFTTQHFQHAHNDSPGSYTKGTMISKSKGDPKQSQNPGRGQDGLNAQKFEIRGSSKDDKSRTGSKGHIQKTDHGTNIS